MCLRCWREPTPRAALCVAACRRSGVYYDKARHKWKASIKIDGKNLHIGYFMNEVDAARCGKAGETMPGPSQSRGLAEGR